MENENYSKQQEMLFSIVLRLGNTWFLLCLEWVAGCRCNITICTHNIFTGGGVFLVKSNL